MNLKELSQVLGLSQTTVSRALNGYPEVSEATRDKVLRAAAKHKYTANTRAKGLATGRSHAIGHVIPTTTTHEMVNPIFGDFIAGAGEVYAKNGYEMVMSAVEDGGEEDVYRSLHSRGTVDGIILHGPKMNDPRIDLLRSLGVPFVVHGRASGVTGDYSWLDVNNRQSFRRAAEFLFDLGHVRIGLLNGLETMDFADRRQMLDLPQPPTAFLVSSIISAIGVRRALEDRGLKMGKDVSIVTHDDALSYMVNGAEVPIFTSTRSSVRDAGRALAQMLLHQIATPQAAPQQILWEAELMLGQSTGPAPRQDHQDTHHSARYVTP